MMFSIISEVNIRKVFNRVIQAGLDIIFSEGEVREVSWECHDRGCHDRGV